jgi:hypothetical protein
MTSSISVNALQRFGLKIFLKSDINVDPRDLIPIFHQWIQKDMVGGLLIDVADYTHLIDGPRVLLVGYEGNYSLDYRNNRPGLCYYRKRPTNGTFAERLVELGRTVLKAACLLEKEGSLSPSLRFVGNEIEFITNDRLLSVKEHDLKEALQPELANFLSKLYPEQSHEITLSKLGKERPTFKLRAENEVSLKEVLTRIS